MTNPRTGHGPNARRPRAHLLPTTLTAAATSVFAGSALAQDPPSPGQDPTVRQLLERIEAQDRRIDELNQRVAAPQQTPAGASVAYDKGYVLRSTDPSSPFELRINGRMQFRFVGFDPDSDSATTNSMRNDFEIERGRLEFRGTWLDPDTHFYINLDADTDDEHVVIMHDFWMNHEFCDAFDLYVGKAFVPGSRDWLAGSTTTHLIDRSLANSFFRPDRSVGVWAIGEPLEDVHYRVMVANGFNTTDLPPGAIDGKFTYSGSVWWDPLADYGSGYADLQQHEDLAVRLGASLTYARDQHGQDPANQEADAIRYSDGRRLTADGVERFDLTLGAVDLAMKYQGFAANAEAYFRQLDAIDSPTMPMLARGAYDWGGHCDVGYMIVPKRFDIVARVSTVQGDREDAWEYAGGCNWYIDGTHQNKLSFDASLLDDSPTNSSGPNYRVNDDGWLFRVQWQIAF